MINKINARALAGGRGDDVGQPSTIWRRYHQNVMACDVGADDGQQLMSIGAWHAAASINNVINARIISIEG